MKKQEVKIDKTRHDKMFGKQEAISLDGKKHDLSQPTINLEEMKKNVDSATVTKAGSKEIEIEPILTYVYLKEEDNDGFIASEGGIILGRSEESDYRIGTTISVGKDVTQVTPGTKFMYHKAAIQYLECYGKSFPLIMEKNIICKIK
jgi:co-chaperonin GroES (HSP10)